MPEAELVLDVHAQLGEGPIWDAARQRLLFVDIMRGYVHEFDPANGKDRVLEVGQPVGAVAPTVRGDWVVAARDGFFRLDPKTGKVTLIAHVERDVPETRMNDGYVDARGRFWAGTMGMGGVTGKGSLYRLDPDGTVTQHVTGVSISNGIDWSPDGTLMYHVDTDTSRVDVFDFADASGTIRNRRVFVTIPSELGFPDGLIVDAEGCVWLALWEGGAVHRYRPNGDLDAIVPLPVSLVTKCAFGGPDLADLYITTAWIDLDPAERPRQPQAGGVFRLRPGARGRPATRFAG
ncbi:MAG TPA: SMP-30/gluconolactonase/LRE family protein [Vicinamibacterales bacterium]|nr:SMP-30/gluconolactonase/LRE family protein [Vicinamibacterales bacterium]